MGTQTERQMDDRERRFREMYREYARPILNLAYRMTGSDAVARDLTQDVFLKVFENMEGFRDESAVYTWIYRIALNHIQNHLKRERQVNWLNFFTDSNEEQSEPADESADWKPVGFSRPDHQLEGKEREAILLKKIAELKPEYRIPLVLNRYEDMDYQTIAGTLGVPVSTVETRIFRAKKQLAAKLKPWFGKL